MRRRKYNSRIPASFSKRTRNCDSVTSIFGRGRDFGAGADGVRVGTAGGASESGLVRLGSRSAPLGGNFIGVFGKGEGGCRCELEGAAKPAGVTCLGTGCSSGKLSKNRIGPALNISFDSGRSGSKVQASSAAPISTGRRSSRQLTVRHINRLPRGPDIYSDLTWTLG